MRLMGKVTHSTLFEPFGAGNTNHPSATNSNDEHIDRRRRSVHAGAQQPGAERGQGRATPPTASTRQSLTTLVEPLAGGQRHHHRRPAHHVHAASRSTATTTCRAIAIRTSYTFRDDFTLSYDAAGRHDLKLGGEYLHLLDNTRNCNRCGGRHHRATADRCRPTSRRSFPMPFNADTWNLAAISSDHDALHGRRVGLVGVPDADPHVEVRRAGRRTTGRSRRA